MTPPMSSASTPSESRWSFPWHSCRSRLRIYSGVALPCTIFVPDWPDLTWKIPALWRFEHVCCLQKANKSERQCVCASHGSTVSITFVKIQHPLKRKENGAVGMKKRWADRIFCNNRQQQGVFRNVRTGISFNIRQFVPIQYFQNITTFGKNTPRDVRIFNSNMLDLWWRSRMSDGRVCTPATKSKRYIVFWCNIICRCPFPFCAPINSRRIEYSLTLTNLKNYIALARQ